MTTLPQNIKSAYKVCAEITQRHYENFPVASILLPSRLRKPISAIYCFARTADDLADEGDLDAQARLSALEDYSTMLNDALNGIHHDDPIMIALAHSVKKFELTPSLLTDLLDAFKQDVSKTRYAHFDEVLDYCRRSANPVGRLLIQLVAKDQPHAREMSDSVCTALQLINFYQDIGQDYDENNRIYLAQDEMNHAGIDESYLKGHQSDKKINTFMNQQVSRADKMLISGYPLCRHIGGRLGIELKMTIHAAHLVANKMLMNEDCFTRPRLTKRDWPVILFKSIFDVTPTALKHYGESVTVN